MYNRLLDKKSERFALEILLYVQVKIKRRCTVILLEKKVMSPRTHLVKNLESQSRRVGYLNDV